jgi:hypothetical protein
MWASADAYRVPLGMPRSSVLARASRAIASAIRLAVEPPPVKLPPKPGTPIASASHRTTTRSIVTAPGDERHAVTFWLSTLATRSAAAATGSPDPST